MSLQQDMLVCSLLISIGERDAHSYKVAQGMSTIQIDIPIGERDAHSYKVAQGMRLYLRKWLACA